MSFTDTLREYIAAAFPGLWVQTFEPNEAAREIALLARDQKWSLASWDIDQGLKVGQESASETTDPIAALGGCWRCPSPIRRPSFCCPTSTAFCKAPKWSSAWPTC